MSFFQNKIITVLKYDEPIAVNNLFESTNKQIENFHCRIRLVAGFQFPPVACFINLIGGFISNCTGHGHESIVTLYVFFT